MNPLPVFPSVLESIAIILVTIWSVGWKGFALWNAVGNKQKNWFIGLTYGEYILPRGKIGSPRTGLLAGRTWATLMRPT